MSKSRALRTPNNTSRKSTVKVAKTAPVQNTPIVPPSTLPTNLPASGSRRSIARIAGVIGFIGIAVAIVLYLTQQVIEAPEFIAAVIGLGGLTVWLSLSPDDLRQIFTPRRALYGGNSLLISALAVAIAVIVYSLASSLNVTADLTEYRNYTLRPDVSALVKGLTKPVMITVFYSTAQLDQQAVEQPILNLFKDAGHGMVLVNVVDPDLQPTVAQTFGARANQHAFVSDVTADGKPDTSSGNVVTLTNDYVGEQQVADAILQLVTRGQITALFSVGHGEVNTDASSRGIATQIRSGLDRVGIQTGTINLSKSDIPAGTGVVILLAPHLDFTAAETSRIVNYMSSGGSVLIMALPPLYVYANGSITVRDVTFLQDNGPMNTYLWQTWGIRPQNDIVYDPGSYVDNPYQPLTAKAANHPIMQRDSTGNNLLQALLYLPRSWEIAPAAQMPANVQITPLILTSDKAYGATDIRQVQYYPDNYQHTSADLKGPLVLAAAALNSVNHSHLVVIGDSQWATDQVVQQYGNALLWSNMINWLTAFDQRTTVSPTSTLLPLVTTTTTLNTIAVLTLLALPGTILIVGALVWWLRTRR